MYIAQVTHVLYLSLKIFLHVLDFQMLCITLYYNLNTENILNKEYGVNNKSQPTFPFVLSLSAQADITNGSLTAKQHIMS